MGFVAVVNQVIALLRQRGGVTYCTLQWQFPDSTGLICNSSVYHSTRWNVQYLISAAQPSDGSTHLPQRGRLDLTVEARVVAHATWHELFTREEHDQARRRLIVYEYAPREPHVHR